MRRVSIQIPDNAQLISFSKAMELCNSLVEEADHTPIEEVSEVSFESLGRFETEYGYKEMTFREFLGKDFVYEQPTIICWNE